MSNHFLLLVRVPHIGRRGLRFEVPLEVILVRMERAIVKFKKAAQ